MHSLPDVFLAFLRDNAISPAIYDRDQAKHFHCPASDKGRLLHDPVAHDPEFADASDTCPDFYTLSPAFSFARSALYTCTPAVILPMELSSGVAVSLLNLQPSDHLLDLCCAPGCKLVLAARTMHATPTPLATTGIITGVDISPRRLANTRALLKKYSVPHVRLFQADGTTFAQHPIAFTSTPHAHAHAQQPSTPRPFHASTSLRKRPTTSLPHLYHKVMVDAQCTHDGSIKHIRKHLGTSTTSSIDWSQFHPDSLAALHDLQFRLISNGFELLQPGGIMIYSTCSLSRAQNELIAERFLQAHPHAQPLPFAVGSHPSNDAAQFRFHPGMGTGGFFIFRVTKAE